MEKSKENSKQDEAGLDPSKTRYYDHCVKRRSEDKDFLVEDWYPRLKNFTPKSIFLDLSEEEGIAIINFYRTRFSKRNELTFENTEILKALEKRLDNTIKTEFASKAAFVRLSTRSPKDGISNSAGEIMKKYESEYKKLKAKWKPETWNLGLTDEEGDANIRTAAMFRAQEVQLKCLSGSDAIALLVSSQRVLTDINTELTVAESGKVRNNPDQKWNIKISLREWMDSVDGFMEFRCFVKDNIFRAISQYNHYIIIGDLLDKNKVEEIKKKILTFWNKEIKDLLSDLKDYVIDFAVLPDGLHVIELNPYQETTGPGLFDWNYDKELKKELSESEAKEYEVIFKIKQTPYPNIVGMFNEFFLDEMEKTSQEEPYWVLMTQSNPKYREEEKKCQIF